MKTVFFKSYIKKLLLVGAFASIPILAYAADTLINSQPLRDAVKPAGMVQHLQKVQDIYYNNGGHREFGTTGYTQTLDYIQQTLIATKYYNVSRNTFTYPFFTLLGPATLQQISPTAINYVDGTDMITATYSGNGDVTAEVVPIDVIVPAAGHPASAFTSGCEASDFASVNVTGKIALMQRGTCAFALKVANAVNAGAIGVILFNRGDAAAFSGVLTGLTVTAPVSVPVVGTTYALGENIVNEIRNGDTVTFRIKTNTISENRTGEYIIADTKQGDANKVIMTQAEPGAGDGLPAISLATGLAANLEIAKQLPKVAPPINKVRFLFANTAAINAYRNSLSDADYQKIAAVLGVSYMAAPNGINAVMDGDFSSGEDVIAPPNGSGLIESLYLEYLNSLNIPTVPLLSSTTNNVQIWSVQRAPFRAVGGINSGAGGIKSAQEASVFGGTAGIPYNPLAGTLNDIVANVNLNMLNYMADAHAHVIFSLMRTKADIVDGAVLKPGKGNDYVLPNVGICGDALVCTNSD